MTELLPLWVQTPTSLVLAGAAWALDQVLARRVAPRARMLLYLPCVLCLLPFPSRVLPAVVQGVHLPLTDAPAITEAVRSAPAASTPSLGLVWLLGVLLIGGRMWLRHRAARMILHETEPAHGVRVHPTMGPAVVGVLHPQIVMPAGLLPNSSTWRAAVLHEQAHIDHRDPLLLGAMNLCCVVLWPLPSLWLARHRVQVLMEQSADAVAAFEVGARTYGEALLDASAPHHAALSLHPTGAAELRERLTALAHLTPPTRAQTMSTSLFALFALVLTASADEAPIQYEVTLYSLDAGQAAQLGQRPRTLQRAGSQPVVPEGAVVVSRPVLMALPGQEAMFSIGSDSRNTFSITLHGARAGDGWLVDLELGRRGMQFADLAVDAEEVLRARYKAGGQHWLMDLRIVDAER